MIPIGNVDWNAIKAEYIGGGISQRKLAVKHGVSADVLMQKANREGWKKDRDAAMSKAQALVKQKTAETISDNATIAGRIKQKLLIRLEREIDRLPETIGSESTNNVVEWDKSEKGNKRRREVSKTNKLKDLTAAYKDLTDDMPKEESTETMDKLDKLLEMAWDVAHKQTS